MFEGEKGREGERERGRRGDLMSSQLSKRLLALIRKLS